jgi:hypothetical protein
MPGLAPTMQKYNGRAVGRARRVGCNRHTGPVEQSDHDAVSAAWRGIHIRQERRFFYLEAEWRRVWQTGLQDTDPIL